MARRKRKQRRLHGLGAMSKQAKIVSTVAGLGLIAAAGAVAYFFVRTRKPVSTAAQRAATAARSGYTKSLYE